MRSYSGRMSDVAEETRHRIETAGRAARAASKRLALLSRAEKDTALLTLADAVEAASATIVAANEEDLARGAAGGMSESLQDRLRMTPCLLYTSPSPRD